MKTAKRTNPALKQTVADAWRIAASPKAFIDLVPLAPCFDAGTGEAVAARLPCPYREDDRDRRGSVKLLDADMAVNKLPSCVFGYRA